jgi:hypothetical protein
VGREAESRGSFEIVSLLVSRVKPPSTMGCFFGRRDC